MPLTSPCPTADRLEQLVLGRLSGIEAEPLYAHLESCEACQTSVLGFETDDSLIEAIRDQAHEARSDDPVLADLVKKVSGLVGPATEDYTRILEPPEAPDEIGRLGPYRVLRLLGSGGMGVVFQAEEQPLGRLVALKVIRPALAAIPGVRERFLREARAVAAIDDERIVPVFHVGEANGTPYIAMKMLEGLTLDQHLRAVERAYGYRTLPVRVLLQIGSEVAHGLAAAHARGVIHRDIKPGNIFLKGDFPFAVKLLDFGLARGMEDELSLTQPGVVTGTPAYVAPEQFAGGPIGPRCDLYGLGCTLYRIATGKPPIGLTAHGKSRLDHGGVELVPPRELNREVPDELSSLIVELLSPDPARRPPSAIEVAERLTEIDARFADSRHPTARPPRHALIAAWRGVAIVALAVATLVPLTAVTMLWSTGRHEAARTQAKLTTALDPLDEWVQHASTLPGEEQVQAVAEKLKELNPGFDGKFNSRFISGRTVEFHVITDAITDLRPIRAFTDLEILVCRGSAVNKGKLLDLSPIHSLRSLLYLDCSANPAHNLWPLRGLLLRDLICWATPVQNLEPLRGMRLSSLDLHWTFVSDLSHVQDQPLIRLNARAHYLTNLQPLRDMPLEELECQFRPERHAELLRNLKSLRKINGRQVADFWKEYDARRESLGLWIARTTALSAEEQVAALETRLREDNPEFREEVVSKIESGAVTEIQITSDHLTDIAPLRALRQLKRLTIRGSERHHGYVYDLDPIRDLPLEYLDCGGNDVADLSPLSNMKIRFLSCWGTPVNDLAPLATTPLVRLDCHETPLRDLVPIEGMKITELNLGDCRIVEFGPLATMRLRKITADFDADRDAALLKSIPTLEEINGQPAERFLNRTSTSARK